MKYMPSAKRIVHVVAMSAALALVPAAHASANNWNTHGDFEVGIVAPLPGTFEEILSFSLPTFGSLSSVAVSALWSKAGITGGTISLFQGILGDAVPGIFKLSYGGNGMADDVSRPAAGPGSRTYYREVSDTGTGTSEAFYALTSSTAPLPKPQTFTMLLAGLGLMGIVAHRRSKGH